MYKYILNSFFINIIENIPNIIAKINIDINNISIYLNRKV